jgi:hypothetical protein
VKGNASHNENIYLTMHKKHFGLLILLVLVVAGLGFTSCSDDDDVPSGNYFDDACIYLIVKDQQGNIINDSTQLVKVTNCKSSYEYMIDTYEDPFSFQIVLQEDGQWMYVFILNMARYNTESLPGTNNLLLRDTLTLGSASYAFEEVRHYDVNDKAARVDYHTVFLKVNGQTVTSERPKEPGIYLTLQAK